LRGVFIHIPEKNEKKISKKKKKKIKKKKKKNIFPENGDFRLRNFTFSPIPILGSVV